MTNQGWSKQSISQEWSTKRSMDRPSYYPSEGQWQSNGAPVTTQDIQALDTAAWLSATQGSVDLGLSPVLSHESQSTRTLNSVSEPEPYVLPAGYDFSFNADPSWNGPVVYPSPDASSQSSMEYGLTVTHDAYGAPMSCGQTQPGLYPGAHPTFFPQGGQAAYPRRTYSSTPSRPLRPRTEGPYHNSQPAYGPHRELRPQIQSSNSSHTVSSVSNTSGQPQDRLRHTVATSQSARSSPVTSEHPHAMVSGPCLTSQAPVSASSDFGPQIAQGMSMAFMSDPTAEDFGAFINYDQEDHVTSPDNMSYMPGYGMIPSVPSSMSGDVKPTLSLPDQDLKAVYQPSSVATSQTSESEEGRHRSHPLYNEGPGPDGLYHCPYKAKDPNCPHKPTKLKCNYDKYIDSHLKPFRCKNEACSKQEFSSTACLLRHEREAHGMHGHGERPHLCIYPGCDRGIPGNGFPRRYNLFDHMKRVHDHKEEPASSTGSPILSGEVQLQKKSRKRKATSPSAVEPVSNRQRTMSLPGGQIPAVSNPTMAYSAQGHLQHPVREPEQPRDHHNQRMLYSQWANHRDLLCKQMEFVQSPDDVAGLQSFSQNVEEFRRLSEQARRR